MVTADSFEEIFSISARGYKKKIEMFWVFLRDLLKCAAYCSALDFFPGGQFYSNSISVSLLPRNFLCSEEETIQDQLCRTALFAARNCRSRLAVPIVVLR